MTSTANTARRRNIEYGPLDWLNSLPPTISRAEAARYAGCSERHVDREIERGTIQTMKIGRRRVVLRDSFGRWLRSALAAGKMGRR